DNGKKIKLFSDSNDNGVITIDEPYYSPYAQLHINMGHGDSFDFFIDSTVTQIRLFDKKDKSDNKIQYSHDGQLRDIGDIKQNKVLADWRGYKPELSAELDRLTNEHGREIMTNDSINHLFSKSLQQS